MLWVAMVTVLKGRAASFVDYIHVDDLLFPFYLRHACIDMHVLETNQNAILRFLESVKENGVFVNMFSKKVILL